MSSSSSSSKRQRQSDIYSIRSTGITDAALSKILSRMKANPSLLDEVGTEQRIRKDMMEHITTVRQQVQQPTNLPMKSATDFEMAYCVAYKDAQAFSGQLHWV